MKNDLPLPRRHLAAILLLTAVWLALHIYIDEIKYLTFNPSNHNLDTLSFGMYHIITQHHFPDMPSDRYSFDIIINNPISVALLLLICVPFVHWLPHPLIVMQPLSIALGAWGFALLAWRLRGDIRSVYLAWIAWIGNYVVASTALMPAHQNVFALAIAPWMIYCLVTARPRWYTILLVALNGMVLNALMITFIFGLLLLRVRPYRALGRRTAAISGTWILLVAALVGIRLFEMHRGDPSGVIYFRLVDLLQGLLQPEALLGNLGHNLPPILLILCSTGLFILLAPLFLLPLLFELLYYINSQNCFRHGSMYVTLAFLLLGALWGIAYSRRLFGSERSKRTAMALWAAISLMVYFIGPSLSVPLSITLGSLKNLTQARGLYTITARDRWVQQQLQAIEPDKNILTQRGYTQHFSDAAALGYFENNIYGDEIAWDYVIFDLAARRRFSLYSPVNPWEENNKYLQLAREYLDNPNYGAVLHQNGLFILHRSAERIQNPVALQELQELSQNWLTAR